MGGVACHRLDLDAEHGKRGFVVEIEGVGQQHVSPAPASAMAVAMKA